MTTTAAIYSRYSTNLQDQSSITGQVRNCETFAKAKGWKIVQRYSDEATSGTDDSRPNYVKMLADAEAGKFNAIIVDETSRLTRGPGELPRLLAILDFRNQFLVDTKGFDSRSDSAQLFASVYGGFDWNELRKIKERTHRGLRERHRAGFSAGGKCYGYTSRPDDASDPDGKRRAVIVPDQAEIVREIFTRYANGESSKAIANDLNRRGVPSPGSSWKRTERRCRGWVHSAIVGSKMNHTGLLRNEQYVGRILWNRRKSKKVPGSSRRVYEMRPESEWEISEHPELRIIDDALWRSVQQRLADVRKRLPAKATRPRGRPARYLLSGLLKCGDCGSNFIMHDSRAYGCSSHTNGGKHLCDNSLRVRREIAESALLANIKRSLLSDDMLRYVEQGVRKAIRQHQNLAKRASSSANTLRQRLAEIDAKIERVADAIEAVGISNALSKRLARLEADRESLKAEIDTAKSERHPVAMFPSLLADVFAEWRDIVSDMENLAVNPDARAQDVQEARSRLRALLGPVTLERRDGVLWAKPSPNAKSLVDTRLSGGLHINSPKMVAGAGFEPATFGL